jgi:transposase-like protein
MPPGPAPFFRAPNWEQVLQRSLARIPRLTLWCPLCSALHVDTGEWASRPHRTHLCLDCGHTWTPSYFYTFGRLPLTAWEHTRAAAMKAKRLAKALLSLALARR